MIRITTETETQTYSRTFSGTTFEITGDDAQRVARVSGTGAAVSVPRNWLGRRCVVIALTGEELLERTMQDEPQNERTVRGIE